MYCSMLITLTNTKQQTYFKHSLILRSNSLTKTKCVFTFAEVLRTTNEWFPPYFCFRAVWVRIQPALQIFHSSRTLLVACAWTHACLVTTSQSQRTPLALHRKVSESVSETGKKERIKVCEKKKGHGVAGVTPRFSHLPPDDCVHKFCTDAYKYCNKFYENKQHLSCQRSNQRC